MATLSEKVNNLNRKNVKPHTENEEGEGSAPPQSDDGETVTSGDKRESSNEKDFSYGNEVNEQRFVDLTFYRHKIGEGFSQQRQPSDLSSSKPAYFYIDNQVARRLADSKFAAKRQEYSVMVANAFFASITHEAQNDALQALEAGNYGTA